MYILPSRPSSNGQPVSGYIAFLLWNYYKLSDWRIIFFELIRRYYDKPSPTSLNFSQTGANKGLKCLYDPAKALPSHLDVHPDLHQVLECVHPSPGSIQVQMPSFVSSGIDDLDTATNTAADIRYLSFDWYRAQKCWTYENFRKFRNHRKCSGQKMIRPLLGNSMIVKCSRARTKQNLFSSDTTANWGESFQRPDTWCPLLRILESKPDGRERHRLSALFNPSIPLLPRVPLPPPIPAFSAGWYINWSKSPSRGRSSSRRYLQNTAGTPFAIFLRTLCWTFRMGLWQVMQGKVCTFLYERHDHFVSGLAS